jgi:hypothetical protein
MMRMGVGGPPCRGLCSEVDWEGGESAATYGTAESRVSPLVSPQPWSRASVDRVYLAD